MQTLSTTVLENGHAIRLSCQRDPASRLVEIQIDDGPATVHSCADREACYAASREVCRVVYGTSARYGGIDATNSMVWSFTNLIEQVAGC